MRALKVVIASLILNSICWGQSTAPVKLDISATMIQGTNLSSQAIVDIELQVVGRPIGDDHNAMFFQNHDFFFKTLLGAGETREVVHYDEDSVPYVASGRAFLKDADGQAILADGKPQIIPVATHVTFIQYMDGSTWGSPHPRTQASMNKRKDRLASAHAWLSAYQTGGAAAFSAALVSESKFRAEAAMIADQVSLSGADKAAQALAAKIATADTLMATGKF